MSNRVLVDASVALKWVIAEDMTDLAAALLRDWTSAGLSVVAPALFAFEVANVLYRKVGRTSLSLSGAQQALDDLFAIRNHARHRV